MSRPPVPSPRPAPARPRRRAVPAYRHDAYLTAGAARRTPNGWWQHFRAELAYVAGLRRLWLAVAVAGLLLGFLVGTWFGHDLAAQAHLR